MTESPAPQPLPQFAPHKFRMDGWPLCPGCDEDEVYSLIWNEDGPRPSMDEFMAGALACYRCTWKKPAQPKPLPVEGQRLAVWAEAERRWPAHEGDWPIGSTDEIARERSNAFQSGFVQGWDFAHQAPPTPSVESEGEAN